MRRTTPSVLAALVVLLLASCGGGGDEGSSDDAKPYVDAMSKSMAEGDSPMDEEQARCFSEGFIDVVGLDKIKDAGTPEEFADDTDDLEFEQLDLSEDQGNEIYDNFDDCGVDLREALVGELTDDDSISPEAKTCMEDAITDDGLRDFFVTSMVEGEDAVEGGAGNELTKALMGCMMADMESPSSN